MEWHQGELFPRLGFIVTNLSYPPKGIVRFYNGRGTAEQWIKEGKYALNWTRLSCHKFMANQVRLGLFIPSANSGQAWLIRLLRRQLLQKACFARSDKALVPDKYSDETHQDRRKAGAPCQEACVPACPGDSNEGSVW